MKSFRRTAWGQHAAERGWTPGPKDNRVRRRAKDALVVHKDQQGASLQAGGRKRPVGLSLMRKGVRRVLLIVGFERSKGNHIERRKALTIFCAKRYKVSERADPREIDALLTPDPPERNEARRMFLTYRYRVKDATTGKHLSALALGDMLLSVIEDML